MYATNFEPARTARLVHTNGPIWRKGTNDEQNVCTADMLTAGVIRAVYISVHLSSQITEIAQLVCTSVSRPYAENHE